MAKISRDKLKVHGFKRFLNSFKYSMEGLIYAYRFEQSMFIHFIFTLVVLTLNIVLRVDTTGWLITLLCLVVTLAAELFNTAIEAVVDLVTLDIHPLAKIAKDCGSAATFVLSIMSFVLALIIYIPCAIEVFNLG